MSAPFWRSSTTCDDPIAEHSDRVAAEPDARRPRDAGRLRAGAPPAQGAARDRAGDRRTLRRRRRRRAVEAAPNGYLNVFLDRPRVSAPAARRRPRRRAAAPRAAEKTIVEHTAINPNKAAHIGHLRNSALGDTLVRVLAFRGTPVEVQNYIDDTGVQVADVVVGFRELEQRRSRRRAGDRRLDPVRLLLLGSLRQGHRVVRAGQGAAEDSRRDAARHRTWRQPGRGHRRASSPNASSGAISRRWRGSTSTTTC